jgi:hypothetical protein
MNTEVTNKPQPLPKPDKRFAELFGLSRYYVDRQQTEYAEPYLQQIERKIALENVLLQLLRLQIALQDGSSENSSPAENFEQIWQAIEEDGLAAVPEVAKLSEIIFPQVKPSGLAIAA